MNTITNTGIRNISLALAVLLSLVLFVSITPKAQAADLGDYGYGDYYASDFGGSDFGYGDYYASDFGGSDFGYGDYYPDSGFSDMGGFSGGGFSGGGFGGMGGFTMPMGYRGSSGYSSSNTSVYAPTNTCTATNSCNTSYDDHSIFNAPTNIVTNYPPSQAAVYQQPSYPVYTQPAPVYTPPVYYPAQRPVAYNTAPYVTLAAVPYTGLELGPVGTALYWIFLVLWCLLAAYLIAVKKVQNKIAAWFTGNTPQNYASKKSSDLLSSPKAAGEAGQTFVKHNSAPLFAGIDPFIQAQINRAK